jgi:hypothetical protein
MIECLFVPTDNRKISAVMLFMALRTGLGSHDSVEACPRTDPVSKLRVAVQAIVVPDGLP